MDYYAAIKLIPELKTWEPSDVKEVQILSRREVLGLFKAIDEEGLNDIEIASLCLTALSLFSNHEGK